MFNNISLPNGINKDILVNTIMDKCAVYIPLYTDLALLSAKITNFFLKNFNMFSRLYTACTIEYEMINNYDRTEIFSKDENQQAKDIAKYSSTTNQKGTNTALVSPYDANTFTNDTQLQTTDKSELSSNNAVDNTTDITTNYNLHAYGNIGVTTSQQMLESELNIRPKLNIYEIIANFFYKEFVLYTY